MDNDNEVQQADVTAEESPTEPNDQDTGDGGEAQGAAAGSQTTDNKPVPYERFHTVNERLKKESESKAELERKLKEYEERLQPQDPRIDEVKQTLKQLGYVTREDVEAEMKREREDAQLNLELSRLENKHNGKDGLPKFDRQAVIDWALSNGVASPEAAYKLMHQDKIIDWHVKNAVGKTGGVKSEKSDGSGSTQAGVTDSDLKSAAMQGDKGALHTYLKRIAQPRPDTT